MQYSNHQILIVDDEASNIESLFEILQQEGFELTVAANSHRGIEIAQETIPSLIIMDWDMPEMNGIEATKVLRNKEATTHIPIIIATGKMLTSSHLKIALQAGANDFVRKPLDHIEVIARVKAMLQLQLEYNTNIRLQEALHKQELEKLELEIKHKEQELTSTTLQLINKNQTLNLLINDLEMLYQSSTNLHSKALKTVIQTHKLKVRSQNWDEFDHAFANVHHQFYDQLRKAHPHLTTNEERLCAFIKMGLTNREIGELTNRNEEAIKKAKFRLRVKLKLESGDFITEYVQQL